MSIAVLFFVLDFNTVHAGILGDVIGWVGSKAIGGIAWGVSYIIGWIAAVVFALGGALVNFSLELNAAVEQQPIVKIGWQITLGIANLGFVLAIIVIAFATILRIQNYAMKQILWKLIVAALLVNFSLVIGGAFINVANTTAEIFQKKGHLGFTEAAGTLANAFNVQKFLEVGDVSGEIWVYVDYSGRAVGFCTQKEEGKEGPLFWYTGALGTPSIPSRTICMHVGATTPAEQKEKMIKDAAGTGLTKQVLVAIGSIFFTAVFTLLAAFTLLIIAIMLMMRFIVLGILLVLSPLAWLGWVLPATHGIWQKWWDNFLKWTFFAPIVLFFIYLAVESTKGIAVYNPKDSIHQAIDSSFLQIGVMAIIGNMVLIIGFLLGGLIVANSLSAMGAKQAYGFAQKAGKKFGAWSGRMALRGAAYPLSKPYKKEGEKEAKSLAQRFSESKLAKGWANPLAWASRGVTGLAAAGGAREVGRYEKAHAGKSAAELRAALNTALGPERVALIKLLNKKEATEVSDLSLTERKRFARYDQGREYREIEKSLQMPTENAPLLEEMASIMKKYGDKEPPKGASDRDSFEKLSKQVEENNDALFGEMSAKDFSKSQLSKVYTKKASGLSEEVTALRSRFAFASMSRMRPEAISTTVAGLKGRNIIHFVDASESTVNETIGSFKMTPEYQDSTRTNEDLANRLKKLSEAKRENVEERLKYRQEMRDLMEKFGYLKGFRMMNALTKSMAKHSLETPFIVGKEEET